VKFAPKGQCVGLFAGQKWCISGNPGSTLLGHHLSIGSPSVCSQGMPCQVLLSGMLGLGRSGQRQLRFSKVTDSNFQRESTGKMSKYVLFCAQKPPIHCPSIRLGPFLLQIEAGIMSYTRMCLDSCGSLCVQIGRASSSQRLPKP